MDHAFHHLNEAHAFDVVEGGGHPPTHRPIRAISSPLHVVTTVYNPRRFRTRYDLYRKFEKYVEQSGAVLTTVEIAFGERHFEVTHAGNPRHVQLVTNHELWLKENAINVGVSRLPADWKYVAWIDADVTFARPDWVQETLHMLQHHPIVQCFSHAIDLGPDHAPLHPFYGPRTTAASWAYCHVNGLPPLAKDLAKQFAAGKGDLNLPDRHGYSDAYPYGSFSPGHYWHPGFAWACRRDCWDALGGLIDWAIVGAGDHHMATALCGRLSMPPVSRNYRAWCEEWQARAEQHVRGDLGYVDGLITHAFHGPKKSRKYVDRWKILTADKFDPVLDLKRDWQGLWQLSPRSPRLRDELRMYFRQRNEDSVEPY